LRPRLRVAANPALTRSVVSARSHSAGVPNRLNRNVPWPLVVSNASCCWPPEVRLFNDQGCAQEQLRGSEPEWQTRVNAVLGKLVAAGQI